LRSQVVVFLNNQAMQVVLAVLLANNEEKNLIFVAQAHRLNYHHW